MLYEVDIGGRIVEVEQQRSRGVDLYEEGQRVTVGFDDEDGEIVPETVAG